MCVDSAYMRKSLVLELLLKLSDTLHILYNTDLMSTCMKKCPAKNYFWQSDCLSNLAILYGLCFLDSGFFIDQYCAGSI